MSFKIDRQTLDELNLLGKFRQGSVYGLFNQVKTRGGERLLEQFFQHPLDDASAINERSGIFRFFQEARLAFPFDQQEVLIMREWLDSGVPKSAAMTLLTTLVKKGLSELIRDERYKKDVQGLQSAIGVLKRCYSVVEMIGLLKGPYEGRVREIKKLLSDKRLEALAGVDVYQALSAGALARYSHLLKGRLLKDMEAILKFIYEIDLYIAVSGVAHARGFSYARALAPEKNALAAEGLRHPCLIGAIGNSIFLHQDRNVLFLTGANMAGKSTFMKSLGIGVYLAHMGFPVAATSLEFSVREGLYSSINVADNIGLGYSHFYAEVVRVKQAAEAASTGGRLLLMFDELFKGTNVKDAYDGTLAITEAFSEYRNCLFVVSTHIIEVGEALRSKNNIHFVFMPTIMDGVHPRYTYKLQEGITEDRQGMLIIRNEGILELIGS